MTGPEKLKLLVNIDAVWAEEQLRDRQGLTPEGVYQLTLQATGDVREAAQQKAYAQAAKRRRDFFEGAAHGR